MSPSAHLPAPHPARTRKQTPPPGELEAFPHARPTPTRPGSLREALVRWLNEEL